MDEHTKLLPGMRLSSSGRPRLDYLAVAALAFPFMLIMLALGMLIGFGATAQISIRLGEQRKADAERILGNATVLLVVASLSAVVVVSWILRRPAGLDRCTFWGLTLVLGGALGNVYDRIVSGQVTDFLLFYIGDYQWPAFNLADSAIVVGSGLLLVDLVRPGRKAPHVP